MSRLSEARERRRLRAARTKAEREEAKRFTARRRRGRRQLLVGLGILAALLAFVVIGVFSPIMSVRAIEVRGTERLDPAVVQQALADLEGRPLALVTDADLGDRLGGIVEIQSYAARAEPPSTLVVELVERRPVGALQVPRGGYEIYDAAGVVLGTSVAPPADVPVIETGGGGTDSAAFLAAAGVMLAMPAELHGQVQKVQAQSLDNVTLVLRDGDLVIWGSAERSDRKAEVLATLRHTAGDAVKTYDVTSPDAPVTRTS